MPGLLLGLTFLVLTGCSFFSVFAPAPAAGTQVPIQLDRCSSYPAALCLQSFGLSQNQLLITFYFPAAGSSEFLLKVWQGDAATIYPCTTTDAAPSTIYCTGPLIDLGTAIKIDLFTKTGTTPLAEGDFTLTDLALPTLPFANEGIPAGPSETPAFGSAVTPESILLTPTPGTAYSNPLLATVTSVPGTGYANPTP